MLDEHQPQTNRFHVGQTGWQANFKNYRVSCPRIRLHQESLKNSRMSNQSDGDENSKPNKRPPDQNQILPKRPDMRQLVSNYLQQHPSFCHEYFAENATRQMVQQWLHRHLPERATNSNEQTDQAHEFSNKVRSASTVAGSVSLTTSLPESSTGSLFRSNSCSTPNTVGSSVLHTLPLRKISAHEFEKEGLRLRPIFTTTSEGRPSFLPTAEEPPSSRQGRRDSRRERTASVRTHSSSAPNSAPASIGSRGSINSLLTPLETETVEADKVVTERIGILSQNAELTQPQHPVPQVHSQKVNSTLPTSPTPIENEIRLRELNLMLDLVKDICDELELKSLCHKILQNVSVLTCADRCSLFLVKQDLNEKYFVSTLFDVRSDSSLDDQRMCIRIPWNTGVVGYVANNRNCVNIKDCYKDERFHSYVDSMTGYVTRNMISAPILDHDGNVLAVAQAINKKQTGDCASDSNGFTERDEEIFQHFLQFCGIGLKNAQLYEQKRLENRRNQVLLDLCTMIFEQQTNIEQVVNKVMLHTHSLLRVQRVQVMLLRNYAADQLSSTDYSYLRLTAASTSPADFTSLVASQNANIDSPYSLENIASSTESASGEEDNKKEEQPIRFSRVFDLQARAPLHRCQKCRKIILRECEQTQEPLVEPAVETSSADQLRFREYDCNREQVGGVTIGEHVARTGLSLNIADCRKDDRFCFEPSKKDEINFPLVDDSDLIDPYNQIKCKDCRTMNRFELRSLLCMPIRNAQHKIIGIAQLINKLNGKPFTPHDESLFEAFAIFIGMGIQNTLHYEMAMRANAKHQVTLQCLSYHASASQGQARRLSRRPLPVLYLRSPEEWFSSGQQLNQGLKYYNLTNEQTGVVELSSSSSSSLTPINSPSDQKSKIEFCTSSETTDVLLTYFEPNQDRTAFICRLPLSGVDEQFFKGECSLLVGLGFFRDLQLIERFHIPYMTLCRWLLSVQKNYRNVCYHNWRHAFEVAEMMFTILSSSQLLHHLDQLEVLALMIGCFCHDLDHRGTNNSFEVKNSSPLAQLYSTSTMEHHHFDQCLMILNSPGNQILSGLTTAEYTRVVNLIEGAILATDLAVYLKKRNSFFKNQCQLDDALEQSNRGTLRAMLMTICDLNAVSKPWSVQKHIAEQVAEEFFRQGDFEKQMFNRSPPDMFNRAKSGEMPRMQVEFIGDICQPLFEHFRLLFGQCFVYRDLVLINKLNWVREAGRSESLSGWAKAQMKLLVEELGTLDVNALAIRDEALRQEPIVVEEAEILSELDTLDVRLGDEVAKDQIQARLQ